MQPSRFNVILDDTPTPGSALILNTLSLSLFELEPEYVESYRKLKEGGELTDEDRGRLEEMAVEGYVVPDIQSEIARAEHTMRKMQHGHNSTFNATVVLTHACNLNCIYCYEKNMQAAPPMSQETGDMAVDWIIEQAQEIPARTVEVEFYGGEPLLNPDLLIYMATRLQAECAGEGLEWRFTMTTNGTLLTREIAGRLIPLGLVKAKVTLDGPPEIHNSRRPFRDSSREDSFSLIVDNLDAVADVLPVELVMVLDPDLLDEVDKLMDILDQRGLTKRLQKLSPSLALESEQDEDGSCRHFSCEVDATALKKFGVLRHHLQDRLPTLTTSQIQPGGCSLVCSHSRVVISPEGWLAKCPLVMDRSDLHAGHVESGWNYNQDLLSTREAWRHCLEETDCAYPGICGPGAGCRVAIETQTGSLWNHKCNRKEVADSIAESMRLEYERQMRAEAEA